MLNVMCQYDPECPVHRHRPGTTCPVVYRKRMAVARKEAERRQLLVDLALGVSVFAVVLVGGVVLLNMLIPGFLDTLTHVLGL